MNNSVAIGVKLAAERDVPNRDLVLDVKCDLGTGRAWSDRAIDGRKHFAVIAPSSAFGQATRTARRIVFLLDRSGSMGGSPIKQARHAIENCLVNLSPEDQFGILAFNSTVDEFREEMLPATHENVEQACAFLNRVDARGGTELASGVEAAARLLTGNSGEIFVITDGQVFGTSEIVQRARKCEVRLFCLGIGSASQDRFLEILARQTGGVCRFVTPSERVDFAAFEVFAAIGGTVATEAPVADANVHPASTGRVFAATPFVAFGDIQESTDTIALEWPEGRRRASIGPSAFLYLAGTSAAQRWQVDWLDASGKMQPVIQTPGVYTVPRVSPDGRKLAFIGGDAVPQIYDLDRDTITRITSAGAGGNLAWAPDGKHIVFGYSGSLFWVRSDGVGGPQRLIKSEHSLAGWSFSPDGHCVAYFEFTDTGSVIWVLPLDTTDPDHPKADRPQKFSPTQGNEVFPRFSPDGRWIAYRSDELGSNEIWVRPFPAGTSARYQISSGGAMYPFWSSNRRQLFYETTDHRIMVVDYRVEGDIFKPSKPRVWSARQIFYPGVSNMDIAPDGKRFAVLAVPQASIGERSSAHVTLLLNYFDELKRRIP